MTGNTVIDAVHYTKNGDIKHRVLNLMDSKPNQKWILLTMHRRENYGKPMNDVFDGILELVENHPEIEILMPVHLSPIVQSLAEEVLGNNNRIHLIKPLEVDVFHKVIDKTTIVLTDSGGLQEEAPALDIPVLVLRNKTERPEGIDAGTLKLVGTDKDKVYLSVSQLLTNQEDYKKMADSKNPYGDGNSSKKILKVIREFFG